MFKEAIDGLEAWSGTHYLQPPLHTAPPERKKKAIFKL